MILILMIARFYRNIEIPPEKSLVRINLNIEINVTILLIGPQKRLLISAIPYQLPVRIMKRRILIGIRKGKTIL